MPRARHAAAILSLAAAVFLAPVVGRAAELKLQEQCAPARVAASAPATPQAVSPAEAIELGIREVTSAAKLSAFRGGDEVLYISGGVILAAFIVALLIILVLR